MKTALRVLLTASLAWAMLSGAARASSLEDLTFEDQPKKIIVRLLFSEQVSAEVISHYTNNFVALSIEGLELTRAQNGKKYTPPGENEQFLKHVLLQSDNGSAQIRFYMGKLATPADAQVVPLEGKIVVEIIKPLWKLDSTDVADDTGDTPPPDSGTAPPDNGFIPDEGETPVADDGSAPVEGGTIGIQPGGEDAPPPADGADGTVQPVQGGGYTPGPAYTLFDLDQVPVNQLDIRGMPFDEALVELVAGTGFNVVVGPGIDDAEVNLSFTQKDISLKSAMDLLCFAYDLAYTVKDDAIVFSTK